MWKNEKFIMNWGSDKYEFDPRKEKLVKRIDNGTS
jgi:hypothetical protein